jgi:uncharacterized membrane protein
MASADPTPEQHNIRAILQLEREGLLRLSLFDRVADGVSRLAAHPWFSILHVVWFAVWVLVNTVGRARFDGAPFNLLMLIVSLEAILLTGFVLRAQARMSVLAERRAQLDLQINLLAEQELTAILRVLCTIGDKVGIDVASCDPRVEQFRSQTDVAAIAAELEVEKAAVDAVQKSRKATAALDTRRAS